MVVNEDPSRCHHTIAIKIIPLALLLYPSALLWLIISVTIALSADSSPSIGRCLSLKALILEINIDIAIDTCNSSCAAGGKDTKKKDLASIAMSYGYVYVAQIAMGADYNQTVKALAEAEAYNGPSLIIAYAPCINHGIKKGMSKAMTEEKLAVETGYWNNFRFNPEAENKFSLDSKTPTGDYQEFLKGEVRYASLALKDPERANKLFEQNEENAKERFTYLEKLVTLYSK